MAGATSTQWILELVDKISGPSQAATEAANHLKEAVGKITERLDVLETRSRKTGSALDVFGQRMMYINQISDLVGKMNSEISNVAAPGENFEYAMAELRAIGDVTGETLERIGKNARESALKFGGDASGAVGSYTVLLSKLSNDLAKHPAALAIMGDAVMTTSKMMKNDAASAVDALTTSMNQFGISLDDPMAAANAMYTIMNIMAAGSKVGSSELMQQKAAYEQCGAAAKSANVSFAETNAAIQVLDKAGKKASEGGVAIRNVIGIMARGRFLPKDVKEEVLKLNIDINKLSDTSLSFSERLRILKPMLNDSALFSKMFGMENANAAMALVNGVDKMDKYTAALTNTTTAIDQAGVMMDTRREKSLRYQAFWDDLKISVFSAIDPMLPFINMAGIAMEKVVLLGMTVFSTSQIMKTSLAQSVWSGIKSLFTLQFSFQAAARSISAAIYSIPIVGWIAGGIAVLTAFGIHFYNTSEKFRSILFGIWEATKTVFVGIGTMVKEVMLGVWDIIQTVMNPANWFGDGNKLKEGADRIAQAARTYGENVGKAFAEGREKGIESFRASGQEAPKGTNLDLSVFNQKPGQFTAGGGGGEDAANVGLGGKGGSGGGRNVTMNVTLNNHFNVASKGMDIQAIVEQVCTQLSLRLGDAMVATS